MVLEKKNPLVPLESRRVLRLSENRNQAMQRFRVLHKAGGFSCNFHLLDSFFRHWAAKLGREGSERVEVCAAPPWQVPRCPRAPGAALTAASSSARGPTRARRPDSEPPELAASV